MYNLTFVLISNLVINYASSNFFKRKICYFYLSCGLCYYCAPISFTKNNEKVYVTDNFISKLMKGMLQKLMEVHLKKLMRARYKMN
jgi:hypothetical protein